MGAAAVAARVAVALDGDPMALGGIFYAERIGATRWNGWARPVFGESEARRIVDAFPGLSWDSDGSTVVDVGADGEYAAAPVRYAYASGGGRPVWALGDGWVWLEVDGGSDGE